MIKETKYPGYSCDALGNVYNKHGKTMRICKSNHISLYVDGVQTKVYVHRLIYETFNEEIPDGMVVMRKFDRSNALHNLYLETVNECSRKSAITNNSREVAQFDENGNFVKKWRSARQCARELFCCHSTISKICNGEIKDAFINVKWYR